MRYSISGKEVKVLDAVFATTYRRRFVGPDTLFVFRVQGFGLRFQDFFILFTDARWLVGLASFLHGKILAKRTPIQVVHEQEFVVILIVVFFVAVWIVSFKIIVKGATRHVTRQQGTVSGASGGRMRRRRSRKGVTVISLLQQK